MANGLREGRRTDIAPRAEPRRGDAARRMAGLLIVAVLIVAAAAAAAADPTASNRSLPSASPLPAAAPLRLEAVAETDGAITSDGFHRAPSHRHPQARARGLLEQGQSHAEAGDPLSAARAYQRALEYDPGLTAARHGYVRILIASNRPGRARQVLRDGLERGERDLFTVRAYAHLAAQAGDLERAIAALEAVCDEGTAKPAPVCAHLAALYRSAGRHDEALQCYTALAEAEPDNGLWPVGAAVAAEQLGDTATALAAWRTALQGDGLNTEVAAYAQARIAALEGGE